MATQSVINKRQAEAEARINSGVSALADKFGIEIGATNYPVRDAEMRRVIGMENLASALNQIVEAAMGKSNEKETNVETGEAETAKEEIKSLAKMNKSELIAYADENNVEGVFETMTKAEIVEQIESK